MDLPVLLVKTIVLRPYVFVFLAVFLVLSGQLLGRPRTLIFFAIGWVTAFACEFSSTRTGFPFGWYYYTGSTVGEELYISNVPFMDSLSFTFLLYASYCLALLFLLPAAPPQPGKRVLRLRFDRDARTSTPVLLVTALFYVFIDVVIDPVALRGDRWFLGQIYGYPSPGVYFGVPLANFLGWAVVGLIALSGYFVADRLLPALPWETRHLTQTTGKVLWGCGLYYGVLLFNLAVTFSIGEPLLGTAGIFIYLPITAFVLLRLADRFPPSPTPGISQ
ncbi:carotenoid biosynthesis protein [Candidatus Nitrospira bockiana]